MQLKLQVQGTCSCKLKQIMLQVIMNLYNIKTVVIEDYQKYIANMIP